MFSNFFNKQTTFKINNLSVNGRNIRIENNRIFIDGNEVKTDEKEIVILVQGNVHNMDIGYCKQLEVVGDVDFLTLQAGEAHVKGNIGGDIETASGDVCCEGNIGGDVKTMSGNVECGDVEGNIETMTGNVRIHSKKTA